MPMHVCVVTVLCAPMSVDSIVKQLQQRILEPFYLEIVNDWLNYSVDLAEIPYYYVDRQDVSYQYLCLGVLNVFYQAYCLHQP